MATRGSTTTRKKQSTGSNRSAAAKKAAETRKSNDPEAFRKMGEKGGSRSHRGSERNR